MELKIELPSLSNKSPEEIVNIVNSVIGSDFKEVNLCLKKQVENNNLKDFKREKLPATYRMINNKKDCIGILDLKFRNNKKNGKINLKYYRYTIKIPNDSILNKDNIKISVPNPWFIHIVNIKTKKLKTQKNITINFLIGFRYTKEIKNDELYPNKDCKHEFKLLYKGGWCLIWECKKCGFICICSCFKKALDGCKHNNNPTIHMKISSLLAPENLIDERGFSFKDLNINNISDIPYYDNACEVCRGKIPSRSFYCELDYRNQLEKKFGAYIIKKYIEYKISNKNINDEELKQKAYDSTREEMENKGLYGKFTTETNLYLMVKSIFQNNKVLHNYYPKWLEGQEADIFVPHLNLVIEYDGEQHFKAIKAWGGEKGLKKNIERDKRKNEKCKKNNITLIRFNYKEKDLLSENYVRLKLIENGINV